MKYLVLLTVIASFAPAAYARRIASDNPQLCVDFKVNTPNFDDRVKTCNDLRAKTKLSVNDQYLVDNCCPSS